MNKRIKELMAQAMEQKVSNNMAWEELNPEKFAELIIRECVDVIQKEVGMKYKDGNNIDTEEFMGGHYAASVLARVKIKQHFGVE